MTRAGQGRPLAIAKGIVDAPSHLVTGLMLEVRPGPVAPDNAFLLYRHAGESPYLRGGPDRFTIDDGFVVVDRCRSTIALEGHWWYRGEYGFRPHHSKADATEVAFRLSNIAGRRRWMVHGIVLQHRLNGTYTTMRTGGLDALLRRIGDALGCPTRLLRPGPTDRAG